MKPLVYYYCLDLVPNQQASVEASLRELVDLMKRPPLEVDCRIERLPEAACQHIPDDLGPRGYLDCFRRISATLSEVIGLLPTIDFDRYVIPRLIICCDRQHPLAEKCLAGSPGAFWGVAERHIAAVYELSNRCATWHELLHTLGALDCYDTKNPQANPGPTCKHPHCIMQYAPTVGSVDGRLPLCDENIIRIRGLFCRLKN